MSLQVEDSNLSKKLVERRRGQAKRVAEKQDEN